MKGIRSFLLTAVLVALSVTAVRAQGRASLSGRVTDAAEGFPLAGANVVLLDQQANNMISGAATDNDGRYRITEIEPGAYVLAIRFVGYREERVQLTLTAGEARIVNAALSATGFDLNTVVVTASRHAEKVLDAPASISVLETEEIESTVAPSSAAILRNTTGVDMSQTGVDHYEIVLRGFNNAFSGAAYVLTDYRQGAIASLGVNAYEMMPITQIDLDRIEVVRGPGSALYGAGVDAGVIHFMTKDPFTYPGTTISLGGGERSLLMASLRHAGVVNGRIGYKLVGNFSRADEWEFDCTYLGDAAGTEPSQYLNCGDQQDFVQVAAFRRDVLPVDYNQHKANLNGTVAYRFRPNVTLTANGGFSTAKSIFLSGIGTLQSDGFGYTYGQLRLQAGNFFAQAYLNRNDAGDSFVYRATAVEEVVDNSVLFNAQTQYDFSLAADRLRLILGLDYELTTPRTEETITGRNEKDDQVIEAGVYSQATAVLSPKLDATLALRGDYNNVVDAFQLSPRAALVFKPAAGHSLRATFNRAFSSPGINSLFLDINAGAAGPLTIRARGSVHGFAFQRDAQGELVASSLIPAIFGSQVPVGMPLRPVYQQVYTTLAAIPTPQLRAILRSRGLDLPEQQIAALVGLLSPNAGTNVGGFTSSNLGWLNLTTLTIDKTGDDVVDIAPLDQTISHTYELGYKGIFAERVLLAVDAYYATKRNFVGPLLVESPFVLAPASSRVISDLEAAMATGIAGNATLAGALQQLGLTPQLVAQLIRELAQADLQASLPAQGSPIGLVQPKENAIPGQLLLAYRNFGDLSYYGVDLSSEVLVNDRLNVFGNMSWVSDNFFDDDELDEEGSDLELAMNAPKIKVKGGFDYGVPGGVRFNSAVRYVGSFEVRSGPYQDKVPSFTLLDVGAGYDFSRYADGLRIDVTVMNVLNEKHRQFVGTPQLGRLAMARVTYNL